MDLKDINNLQDAFDHVVSSLIAQGCGSGLYIKWLTTYSCRYRDLSGNKCAAGWLIKDDLYDPSMEGRPASEVISGQHLSQFGPGLNDHLDKFLELIDQLQTAHDDTARATHLNFVEWFKVEAKVIASKFNLEWKYGDVQ